MILLRVHFISIARKKTVDIGALLNQSFVFINYENNPSEIHKIIWERSEEIASSQVHLSLSEILAKVMQLFFKLRS